MDDPRLVTWNEGDLETEEESRQTSSLLLHARRRGMGLCLSGGGYRAALFHLGAVRRLNELGLLHQARTISSVSGGSVLSGRLARALPWLSDQPFSAQVWEKRVAIPMRRQAERDVRTYPILNRVMPWNWKGPSAIYEVAGLLDGFYGRSLLTDVPTAPDFVFCASDLTHGTIWTFRRDKSGSHRAGTVASSTFALRLSQVVAISACFPPVFSPVELVLPGGKKVLLNDGGNYDNLGLEPVWKKCELVLVSDGGTPFTFGVKPGVVARLSRFVGMLDAQSRSLRKRWLFAGASRHAPDAVYWSVGRSVESYRKRLPANAACLQLGYTEEEAQWIGNIRTDFNCFKEGERAVLENHGYVLADAALLAYLPEKWKPAHWPVLSPPFPDWLGPEAVRRAVK